MEEFGFSDIVHQLIDDCQSGFFLYTLIYFGLRFKKPKEKLRDFDWSAALVVCGVSAVYLIVYVFEMVNTMLSEESRAHYYQRLISPYGFALWIPPLMYMAFPFLLLFRKVRENFLTRFIIAFLLFFNFEKFVIIVTSIHRDYLPGSWSMDADPMFPSIAYAMLWKLALFTGLAALLFSFRRKRDNFAT